MNEDIIAKLHTALYHISPLVSERDRIITSLGEVIWLETLEQIIVNLPEDKRVIVVDALNQDDVKKAIAILEEEDVKIEEIMAMVTDKVFKEEIE